MSSLRRLFRFVIPGRGPAIAGAEAVRNERGATRLHADDERFRDGDRLKQILAQHTQN